MKIFLPLLTTTMVIMSSCVDKFVIPENINTANTGEFGAGDTTYLQLSPVWDNTYGIIQPVEISIAQDGRVFVADSGSQSIHVFSQDGDVPDGFEMLKQLKDHENAAITPIDVDIDKKMNVFFIDGSQRVFVWNQYWNSVGISRVSISGSFLHIESGAVIIDTIGSGTWLSYLNNPEYELTAPVFSNDQGIIDSLLYPHLFFDGRDEKNILKDIHYKSDSSKFTGLTSPADNENMLFVTDNYGGVNKQHRIVQIDFQKSLILELTTGDIVWGFTGEFGATVKGYGRGAGTVNEPLSLDVDYNGNIYYTQSGDFFPVHMIMPNLSGDFATYLSGFQPEADDIMDASFYANPLDIAVDNNKNIYVVDKDHSHVLVFNSRGQFFKNAGYASSSDSISIMMDPVAVTVDERGVVYVCDKGNGAIYRFKLSNSLDEDLKSED
jgi:hypothetical protein